MKINFRKIASTLASTAMLGSTVALAAAANFPAPFVSNGNADVAIVYGNSLDLVAVTDISTALSSALSSGGGSAGAVSNDAYALFTSSTPLQLNNSISSVRSSLTESSLPTVLSDTDFSGNVDATAQFQIVLGHAPRVIYAKEPTTGSDPAVGVFFGTSPSATGGYLYNSTVTFDEAVNFSHADTQGESIEMFGGSYTVSSATTDTKLVLFKSAETLFLSVGGSSPMPSQTVEVEGDTYTIELVAASDTSATVKVTDSAGKSDQKEINEAASKKVLGVEVAINMADESTATSSIQAEILVGANRLTFQDGEQVKVGTDNDAIDGTLVEFNNGNTTNLVKMTVQVFASDGSHDFIQAGDEFVDPVFGSFRMVFDSLASDLGDTDVREEIEISPSGTDMASISFTSWQGETLNDWDWLNNQTGGNPIAFLGDDNEWPLIVREGGQINESAFALVGNEDEGVLIELSDITNGTTGFSDDSITFRNVITGKDYGPNKPTSEGAGSIDIEGNSYAYTYVDNKAGDNSQHVRLNFPDSSGNSMIMYPTIETSEGANLAFYEPKTVTLTTWDGVNTLVGSNVMFPDGDGYTNVAIAAGGGTTNYTVGGTLAVNTTAASGASSVVATVGTLTYNFSSVGTVNQVAINLMDSGVPISRPGIILFEEQDEADTYNTVIVETSGGGVSDSGVSISEASFSWNNDADLKGSAWGSTGVELESADDMFVKLDQWGTLVTTDQTDSDQYSMVISYPDVQTTAMIYVDSLGEGSGSGSLGNVRVLDEELASSGMSSKNLIVVGGSCVNTAASTLLNNAGCGASWTAATGAGSGEWVIQTLSNPWASSKVATLVAGWEQGDTANAATYLKTQNPLTNVGHKLTGTTATTATVVTA